MFYLFQPLKHLRRVQSWAKQAKANIHLSAETFALTITHNKNILRLQPRFVVESDGQPAYTRELRRNASFVGWVLPETVSWPAALDKIVFKQQAHKLGLRVPSAWNSGNALAQDFLIKTRKGSFGKNIQGPFHANEYSANLGSADEYFEQFIPGHSAKAWCWNGRVVALEVIEPPYLIGDGHRKLHEIARNGRGSMDQPISLDGTEAVLAWQGLSAESIVESGRRVWLDFRYATSFDMPAIWDRDVWMTSSDSLKHQFSHAAASLYKVIPPKNKGKNLSTLDAVIDDKNRVWFLEVNSHPMVHPNIYEPMLNDLFLRVSESAK